MLHPWSRIHNTGERLHLDRASETVDPLIAKVNEAISRLREYRTALISAAVTGKIDVRGEAE